MSTPLPAQLLGCRDQGHVVARIQWPIGAESKWICQEAGCLNNPDRPEPTFVEAVAENS